MSIIKMLDGFTSENLERKKSRREMFGTMGSIGKKVAMAAVPFGLASSKARAAALFQETSDPVGALQFALLLERLEDSFYMQALESGVLTGRPARVENVINDISAHESAHVAFLESNLTDAGVDVGTAPEFDFTAGGAFDPFNTSGEVDMDTSYAQFLALAQAFEDTGVRAYKGQAPNLMNTPYLEPALQIHSVEARHASAIRRIRGVEGWITGDGNNSGAPAGAEDAYAAVYAGEGVVNQGGVDLTTLDYGDDAIVGDITEAVTQAFDEPLGMDDVSAVASLFIVSDDSSEG